MKKLFDKFKNIINWKKSKNKSDYESYAITITYRGTNKAVFNEVVKMFCDEFKKMGIKINPKSFISESELLKSMKIMKFTFPIPLKMPREMGLSIDNTKKNVQLKIKGVKKYKDISLVGVKKLFIPYSEIINLFDIINNPEVFGDFDGPLFLDAEFIFHTAVFDYKRFTDFAKKLDKHLNLQKVDYVDVKKRVIDAVEEIIDEMQKGLSKDEKIDRNELKKVIFSIAKQGAIKLTYLRNYTWNIEDLEKNPSILEKLSNILEFMQITLNSEGHHKDFLIPTFVVSSELNFVCEHGCFASLNDKTGLDESILCGTLPERMKKL